jgi:D-psicose/D-tagatose/L-ribulose 3-epimerase
MNKIGIYYAYWAHDWDVNFHPFIDKAADLGFDILEVNASTIANMSRTERKALKAHADACNITLSYCIGLTAEHDVASENEAIRKNGLEYLEKVIVGIGEMGGGPLGGINYGCTPGILPESVDKREIVDRSVASIKEVAKIAVENDVLIELEVVNRFEQFIMNCCDEGLDYVKRVDSPNVKIMLDTFHMNIEEDSIGGAIEKAGSYLGHFHISENNRRPPGYGHIPWDEMASALKKINYQGYIVMEPFLMPGGQVGQGMKVFRDMSIGVDLDDEAGKAMRFIRKKLRNAV